MVLTNVFNIAQRVSNQAGKKGPTAGYVEKKAGKHNQPPKSQLFWTKIKYEHINWRRRSQVPYVFHSLQR